MTTPKDPKTHPAVEEFYLNPEDHRSGMLREDDHSMTDFDVDAEIENLLGPEQKEISVPHSAPQEKKHGSVHPGLIASLEAFYEYSAKKDAAEQESADNNSDRVEHCEEEHFDIHDDFRSPMEPEDSGEDDGGLVLCSISPEKTSEIPAAGAQAAVKTDFASEAGAGNASAQYTAPVQTSDSPPDGGENRESAPGPESGSPVPSSEDTTTSPDTLPAEKKTTNPPLTTSDEEEEEEEDKSHEDRPMTLREHLLELRKRVFRAFLFSLGGFGCCYPFARQISVFLLAPLNAAKPDGLPFIYTKPAEAFFTELKIAFVAGIFLVSPLIFYQIWAFIAPGLYKEEKMYIVPVALFSALFFISGGAFCYFVVFPFAFEFFMSYNSEFLHAMLNISDSLTFVIQLLLAFGLVFELPLFVFFLARFGVLTADMMRKFRRYAVLIMFLVAAILTPPDVLSQMLMAGPLFILYEISIFVAVLFGKKKPSAADEDEDEEDEDKSAEARA